MHEANSELPIHVYTLGHSSHTIEVFLGLLTQHDIEVLIDTRSSPFSRYAPQFNRDALKASVEHAGLRYGFFGRHLGGRPDDEDLYDENGHVLYSAVAKSFLFNDGLERLIAGAAKYRTALLCSEENPSVCHRRLLVGRVLFESGIGVFHIRGDGRVESEQSLQESERQAEVQIQRQSAEKQAEAERKLKAKEMRRANRQKSAEESVQRRLLCQQALQLAKIERQRQRQEKERQRQEKAEYQAAQRRAKADITQEAVLFSMEEV